MFTNVSVLSDFQCYKLTEDPGNKRTDTTGDGDLILDLRPPRWFKTSSVSLCTETRSVLMCKHWCEPAPPFRSHLDVQHFLFSLNAADKRAFTIHTCCVSVRRPLSSPCRSPGTPGLGLDVEELAEDCSAVRSQLEYLQRLLLQVRREEDTVTLCSWFTTGSLSTRRSHCAVKRSKFCCEI